MAAHKFRVGQLVRVAPDATTRAAGMYSVVQLVPSDIDGVLQYRIKGVHEQHERMVKEHQLKAAEDLR